MANEYLVNSDDLSRVAETIRTKGGTDLPLVFPSGFVTAIQDITGGGGLNIDIVGGTKPTTPRENMIWVDATDITAWIFSLNAPSSPAIGTIWIELSATSGVDFDATDEAGNLIRMKLKSFYRRGSSAWERIDAAVYQNGEWFNFSSRVYLFQEGVGATSGYTVNLYSEAGDSELTKNYIHWAKTDGFGGCWAISPKVNLTDYTTLCVELKCTSRYDNSYSVQIGVGNDLPTDYAMPGTFDTSKTHYSTARTIVSVPIDSYKNVSRYIKMAGYATTGYVYNIWLE